MNWHFLHTGANTGAFNMQFDEQLARDVLGGRRPPTLRLFQWKPWAISLGFNQDEQHIDAARCAANGIDLVRRPTGGRAVFHAEELTYSVVMSAEGKSVLDIYNHISGALVRGLQLYGVDVSLNRSQPDLREHYKSQSSIPCFTASARYEIEWHGRKLVGSAQRRFRNQQTGEEVILQHGSILVGSAHRELVDYLLISEESKRMLADELREKTTDLSQVKNQTIDPDTLATCIRRGFEDEWGITLGEIDPATTQMEQVYG